MTCIVGYIDHGVVHIGGDSLGVGGLSKTTRKDPKVFTRGPFVMGFTTSFRMGQVLNHSLKIPEHPNYMDDYEFMCTRFIDNVRACLKEAGWASKKDDSEEGGTFLVGYRGKLYTIESDYQVGIPSYPFSAVGCGDHLALGAMYALKDIKLDPVKRITTALEAASQFSAGVGPPYNFVQENTKESTSNKLKE